MKKIILSFLFFLAFLFVANAQLITSFSDDDDKFIKELNSFLSNTDKQKAKEIIEEFKIVWESDTLFTKEQKKIIHTLSNRMLKKKCRSYPHFSTFLKTLIAYTKTDMNNENYENWRKGYSALLKNKKASLRIIEYFLRTSESLWKDNVIYRSSSTEWKVDNNNYKYVFDGNNIKIVFGEVNLTCYAKRDSAIIFKTQGIYDPLKIKWTGVNGKVTWQRAGFEEDKVYAYLGKYQIDMKKSNYKADSVTFVNTKYFNEPLMGKLEEKVMADVKPEKASYPRFESYTKRFNIENIYENINYSGGFYMKGAKFLGKGDEKQNAYLYIYREGEIFLTTASRMYVFREDRIIAEKAAITFRLDTDSIYHPGLTFKYLVNKKTVTLIRDKKGLALSPFINTYHGIDMDVEQMTWKIDEPMIKLSALKSTSNINNSSFESSNYFRINRYFELQMNSEKNPLVEVRNYTRKYQTEVFTVEEFANYLRASLQQTKWYLMNIAFKGFVSYNFDNDEITVKPKLYNYIQASIGKRDYDVIKFESRTQGTENAKLSLLNFDLQIQGVEEIFLSDSQNVVIYPRGREINLRRHLNFDFDGKIRAGYFLFSGSNFFFDYEKFKIDLTDVDYVKMRVPSDKIDQNGMPIHVFVKNIIENVTGDLMIDDPNNKSGVKPHPEYPIFNSKKDAYVYYDNKKIFGGVYSRDIFYFQIYPFTMQKLDNMRKDELEFKGYFVSGGIFKPFEDTLRLMPDYSLGLIRKSPPEGYQVYGGKGKFTNDIILSNEGLKGSGTFDYITSTTTSDNFIFFPDSMNAFAQEFVVKEQKSGVEFPSVKGEGVDIHWMPYKDELFASDNKSPITMYDNNVTLHGTAKVQPDGLSGWGKLEFENAELLSDMFSFKNTAIDADTAFFNLKTLGTNDMSFKTENVKAHVDFEKRIGEFQSNGEASFVEFPQNQYICFMDQFNWYMDKEEIEMSASNKALDKLSLNKDTLSPTELEDIQLEGSQFISIHPRQDSLSFVAPSAKYSLRKNIINAKDVKFIRVADATVYPGDGHVIIEKKAKMRTLTDAKIIANITSRFHTIYNATANIYGKKDYTANGDYEYIDEINRKQIIHFDVIGVDSTIQTYATGSIGITDGFTLSPNFDYTGKVKMIASKQNLIFKGSAKIKHECEQIKPMWVKFESEINPKDIYIPISETPVDINNNALHAAFMITNDSAHIYPAFLNKHKKYSDTEVVSANGFLYFDKSSGKYKISSKEKLVEFNMPGNYISIHKSICNMYGEGKVNLGVNLGQVKISSVGNVTSSMDSSDVNFDIFLVLDFFFNNKLLEIMADAINATATEPVDFERIEFTKGMIELVGEEKANEFISNLSLGTFKKFPKELEKPIVFSDIKMHYNGASHTYTSDGPLGISNILKKQIHKFVDGHIEIIKKRSGDIFTLYMQLNESNWYFFTYRGGVMRVVSSNQEFNNIIKEMKPDDRKLKVEKGEKPYSYYPATPSIVKKFLKKFEEEEPDENDNENYDEEEEE